MSCRAILLGIWSWAPATAAAAPEDDSVLARVRDAAIAVQTNLRTGLAEGTYRMWGRNGELVQSARFWGAFDGEKHHLRLEYQPLKPGSNPPHRKRIVVCDGSELFVSRFSERLRPLGAEADVYNDKPAAIHNHTRGFPDRIEALADGPFGAEIVDRNEVTIERLPNGHYRGRFPVTPERYTVFEIAPEYGYLVIGIEKFQGDQLLRRWTATWEHVGDIWYTKVYRREEYSEYAGAYGNYEVRFEKFEPNVPVPGDLFTLGALELPGGAKILDRRPPEGKEFYSATIYQWPDEGTRAQKQADRLIEQVESLPKVQYESRDAEIESRWGRRLLALGLSFLGIVAIVVVWLLRKRTLA